MNDRLGQSSVRYRCACGEESEYQQEAKLPLGWSVRFVTIEQRTWPRYTCQKCTALPSWRVPVASTAGDDARLDQLRSEAKTTRRKKAKR